MNHPSIIRTVVKLTSAGCGSCFQSRFSPVWCVVNFHAAEIQALGPGKLDKGHNLIGLRQLAVGKEQDLSVTLVVCCPLFLS